MAEDLRLAPRAHQSFEHDHCQGINFLPGGTAWNPNSQRAGIGFAVPQNNGQDFMAESLKRRFVAEKLGDVNEKIPVQRIEFAWIAVNELEIIL